MIFQQIRSAAVKVKYDNVVFLIDPWLSDPCSEEERGEVLKTKKFIAKPVTPLPFAVREILEDTDVCLVTHMHEDHFSPDYLPKDIRLVFQNETDEARAKEMGFVNTDHFSGDEMKFSDVTVYRTGGRHGDTDLLAEKAGPVSGFVFVKEGEKTLWIAGDTVFYEGFRQSYEKYHPAVIVVNSCDARTSSGRLIMNTADIVKVCHCAPESVIIASHMDAVSHARLTRADLKMHLRGTPYAKQVIIPQDGEEIRL